MKCAGCNEEIRPGRSFCESCGRPVEQTCSNCHATLAAGARFCGECGTRTREDAAARVAVEGPGRQPASAPAGERRQLTVLFADVVGATELSGRLDPEVLRDLLRSYQRICSDCVDRYGG